MNQIIQDIASDAAMQHITAQQIADRTNLDRKTVAGILNGETENPKCETVQAVAHAVGGEVVYQTADSKTAVKSGDISYYRTQIANKDRWLRWLFFACMGLIVIDAITTIIAFVIASKY